MKKDARRAHLDEEGLTEPEAIFVREYLSDFSPKYAAVRAGISSSEAGPWAQVHLRKEAVKTAIEMRIAKHKARLERTRIRLIAEMEALSFSRITDYTIDSKTGLICIDNVPAENQDAARAAIKSVSHTVRYERNVLNPYDPPVEVHETHITMWDKNAAHRNLGQHLGMFIERTANASDGDNPDGPKTVWNFGGKEITF